MVKYQDLKLGQKLLFYDLTDENTYEAIVESLGDMNMSVSVKVERNLDQMFYATPGGNIWQLSNPDDPDFDTEIDYDSLETFSLEELFIWMKGYAEYSAHLVDPMTPEEWFKSDHPHRDRTQCNIDKL